MKRLFTFLLSAMITFSLCGCNNKEELHIPDPVKSAPFSTAEANLLPSATPIPSATPVPSPTPIPIPIVAAEVSPITYNYNIIKYDEKGKQHYIPHEYTDEKVLKEEYAIVDIGHEITNIPTYTPEWITTGYTKAFTPGFDHGVYNNVYSCYLQYIHYIFPSNALRKIDENKYYIMYDITDSSRLYLFFPSTDNDARLMGYPVFMSKVLSYSDIRIIKLGDDISTVETIDPIAKYTRITWNERTENAVDHYNGLGNKISSIHLLSDGIMRISYELSGEKGSYTFTVSEIEYHEDFKLEGVGGVTDYSIAEVDYVD